MDRGAEDLSLNRGEEDEDDHDEHEDAEKANESDGVEAERLKAFNVSYMELYALQNFISLFVAFIMGICGSKRGTLTLLEGGPPSLRTH